MSNKMLANAIAAVITLGLSCAHAETPTDKSVNPATQMSAGEGMEKCYGINKKGMNDCGTANHMCAGESQIDRDPQSWVSVPTGLCRKIAGGNEQAK